MIYEPKGRALEYAPLACNLYRGCKHRCEYCYGPGVFRISASEWHKQAILKADALARLAKAAAKYKGDPREILFSFATDPYQDEDTTQVMQRALNICERNNLQVCALTKNPEASRPHWPKYQHNGWTLATTIIFLDEQLREKWEPGAPTIASRIDAMRDANAAGIATWISIEPVVDPEEAIAVIREIKPYVGKIKVGKLNHHKLAKEIDWADFLVRAKQELQGIDHLIKKDLAAYGD
jgi:DNA repair photolyase